MHVIERAYALALTGRCESAQDLMRGLRAEGYTQSEIQSHLSGASISRDLTRIRREARLARAVAAEAV
jgi:hypothetical protein